MRSLVALALVALVAADCSAAVLCTRPRKGGIADGTVKVRQTCRPNEIQLAPEDIGMCCAASTTTTSTVSCPTFTTTTLGIPDCGGGFCFGLCANARACVPDPVSGACGCTGDVLPCGVVTYNGMCGGSCPVGQACRLYEPPLPNGCTDAPRCACIPTP